MPIVKVLVVNDDPLTTPLQGATVYFYDTIGVLQTSAMTDGTGISTVTLPDASYDIYVFLQSYSCVQPQRIVVDHLQPQNSFRVSGHLKTLPEPQDPNLCRISGNVITFTGQPAKSTELTFVQIPKNIVVGKKISFYRPIQIKSDSNGYFEFDLLRNTKYKVDYENYDGEELIVQTPDRPAVAIGDFIFPLPVSVHLSQTTITIPNNSQVNTSVTYTINYSDGNTGDLPHEWFNVYVASSNPNVVQVTGFQGYLQLLPIGVGTANVTFSRVITSDYEWINPPVFTSDTLAVTVS